MANPASLFCECMGKTSTINETLKGQQGLCGGRTRRDQAEGEGAGEAEAQELRGRDREGVLLREVRSCYVEAK